MGYSSREHKYPNQRKGTPALTPPRPVPAAQGGAEDESTTRSVNGKGLWVQRRAFWDGTNLNTWSIFRGVPLKR